MSKSSKATEADLDAMFAKADARERWREMRDAASIAAMAAMLGSPTYEGTQAETIHIAACHGTAMADAIYPDGKPA